MALQIVLERLIVVLILLIPLKICSLSIKLNMPEQCILKIVIRIEVTHL